MSVFRRPEGCGAPAGVLVSLGLLGLLAWVLLGCGVPAAAPVASPTVPATVAVPFPNCRLARRSDAGGTDRHRAARLAPHGAQHLPATLFDATTNLRVALWLHGIDGWTPWRGGA